ncbi:MAG: hypothetical protein ACLQFR_07625 [Streptosporangiaceae bacterium]
MINQKPLPPSPFRVGDRVQPKEHADVSLHLDGQRTPPGRISAIKGGAHFVKVRGRMVLPYGAHEIEKVTDAS